MPRQFFVGGNWKMNGTSSLVKTLTSTLSTASSIPSSTQVVLAPPAPYLQAMNECITKANMFVAAQNIHFVENGAYTGEVSCAILKDLNIQWVILGHSERREYFGETDEIVAKKCATALAASLNIIPCIGEKLSHREAGQTFEVIYRQLSALKSAIPEEKWKNVVLAYEPVWAIGTGKVATPAQAQEVHAAIRKWLAENISSGVAESTRIIYGGSVSAANCQELSKENDVDGFLVGGASLKPDFVAICSAKM